MSVVTCIAPVNIAVIKYWGKRDEKLILPINDSISATLDTNDLCAKTTILASPKLQKDRIWLNGREETMDNPRLQNCLTEFRNRTKLQEVKNWKLHICSENNFPTAAGLASSAAGYACLAFALSKIYKVEGDISELARSGSGSACRSVFGGFVRWYMGSNPNGADSIAKPIADSLHWPEMRILILVVNDTKKKVSSALGMKRSVMTSEFLKLRAEIIVPKRIIEMQIAIETRNFQHFAELTIKDSNQMHATCLDTFPPCVYMNDISHQIVELVHSYNTVNNITKVAYTFDAGPNATLFLLEKDVPEFIGTINYFFPTNKSDNEYIKGIHVTPISPSQDLIKNLQFSKQKNEQLKYIIYTRVGDGPKQLHESTDSLLNADGFPKK